MHITTYHLNTPIAYKIASIRSGWDAVFEGTEFKTTLAIVVIIVTALT